MTSNIELVANSSDSGKSFLIKCPKIVESTSISVGISCDLVYNELFVPVSDESFVEMGIANANDDGFGTRR